MTTFSSKNMGLAYIHWANGMEASINIGMMTKQNVTGFFWLDST